MTTKMTLFWNFSQCVWERMIQPKRENILSMKNVQDFVTNVMIAYEIFLKQIIDVSCVSMCVLEFLWSLTSRLLYRSMCSL